MGALDNNIIFIKKSYALLGQENKRLNADYYIAIKTDEYKKWKILYMITERGVLHVYPFKNKVLGTYYNNQILAYEEHLNRIEKNNPDVYLGKKKKEFNY